MYVSPGGSTRDFGGASTPFQNALQLLPRMKGLVCLRIWGLVSPSNTVLRLTEGTMGYVYEHALGAFTKNRGQEAPTATLKFMVAASVGQEMYGAPGQYGGTQTSAASDHLAGGL